jgi:hypothetical protein
MRTLVFSDIHCDIKGIEEFIEGQKPDQVIFLGDYFDCFYDTPEMNYDTAVWLEQSMRQPNRIHLVGNHDLGYISSTFKNWCSGWTLEKYRKVHAICFRNWRNFRFAASVDNILFTHAGVHPDHPKFLQSFRLELTAENMAKELNELLTPILEIGTRYLIVTGYDSMRVSSAGDVGGILWCDFRQFNDQEKLRGLPKQIVGHTTGDEVRITNKITCMDVKGQVLMIDDGVLLWAKRRFV